MADTTLQAPTRVPPAPVLTPAQLLQQLDAWMGLAGFVPGHAWRRTVAAVLAQRPSQPESTVTRLLEGLEEVSVHVDNLLAVIAACREAQDRGDTFLRDRLRASRLAAVAEDMNMKLDELVGALLTDAAMAKRGAA